MVNIAHKEMAPMTATSRDWSEDYTGQEVAIVGMSVRLPGANNVRQFWEMLSQGKESISFFSKEELQSEGVRPSLLDNPDYVRAAGVLDDAESFDAAFFEYTAREAEMMDPQMRIFHEVVWEALEDAGTNPDDYPGAIGLFVGSSSNLLWEVLAAMTARRDVAALWEAEKLFDKDYLPMRISYRLNLRGPSLCISTACSTSLATVHIASQTLLAGECDMALAGGVSMTVPHRVGYLYQRGMVASPDGHCRAFDADAMGTVRGSGAGVVVLKLLENALQDGDCIRAVIRGSAVNNDGRRKVGFTAPSPSGQAEVIRAALQAAGVGPETVSYVEAHGTGTPLGDTVEVEALNQAFHTTQRCYCGMGSVKSNIGHLDAAAGIAGLIKTALALEQRKIPPTINLSNPNPKLNLADSPFLPGTELCDWTPTTDNAPLRAGISSFGIGGTNVHLVLEEAPPRPRAPAQPGCQLVVLSARTETALARQVKNLGRFLEQHPDTDLSSLAYTLQTGRRAFRYRKAMVCEDVKELAQALSPEMGSAGAGLPVEPEPPVVFLFPGQGSQYPGMGREIYQTEPGFRQDFDRCCDLVQELDQVDLRACLDRQSHGSFDMYQTRIAQPLLFSFEYALARLLMTWGVRPRALCGHSIGELTCACLSEVFELPEAMEIVVLRGRLMQSMPPGAMVGVACDPDTLAPLLKGSLCIAAVNSPTHSVVSGQPEEIGTLSAVLQDRGIPCTRLHTSHAFHSPMMEEASEQLLGHLQGRTFGSPTIPWVSNLTGDWITPQDAAAPSYWARLLVNPIQLSGGLEQLLEIPRAVFVEVGPGRTMSGFLGQLIRPGPRSPVFNLVRHPSESVSDRRHLLNQMGGLWAQGVELSFHEMNDKRPKQKLSLPTYPFERTRFWSQIEAYQKGQVAGLGLKEILSGTEALEIPAWFSTPSWERLSPLVASDVLGPLAVDSTWLVLCDKAGLGSAIADRVQSQLAVLVRQGPAYRQLGPMEYEVQAGEAAAWTALVKDVESHHGPIAQVVDCRSLEQGGDGEPPTSEIHEKLLSIVRLVRALERSSDTAQVRLTVLTRGAHEVTGTERLRPDHASLVAAVSVVPQEYPWIGCRQIDLPHAQDDGPSLSVDDLAALLLQDICQPQGAKVLAYRGGYRWTRTFRSLQPDIEPAKPGESDADPEVVVASGPMVRQAGVYLIVGGTGNLGLAFAESLGGWTGGKIVLTARSPFPERETWDRLLQDPETDKIRDIIERIQRIESLGADVLVRQADVSCAEDMQAVVGEVLDRFGRIDGVIHAAGLVKPLLIQEIDGSPDSAGHFRDITGSKIQGIRALDRALRGVRTDFRILTSSLSSGLGGLGYLFYAAGNLYMDAFAASANRRGEGRWTVVNWDAWAPPSEPGRSRGILPGEGKKSLAHVLALARRSDHIVVSKTRLSERLARWIDHEPTDRGSEAALDPDQSEVSQPLAPRPDLPTPFVPPRDDVEKKLARMWQGFFGLSRVGLDDDFFLLGGDSLKAISLLSAIEREVGIVLPSGQLFGSPTIRAISAYISSARTGRDDYLVFNEGNRLQVFCFPPYVCFGLTYYELSKHLGDFTLCCLNYVEIEDIISHFVDVVLSIQDRGPYVLFGYSAGGRVAYEVAKTLEHRGYRVSDLVLLDAFSRWNTPEQFSLEIETARSEMLLAGYDFLFANNEALKRSAMGRLLDYSRLVHQVVVERQLAANIHLIRSEGQTRTEENQDWHCFTIDNTWQAFTSDQYREYQGSGEHMDMLFWPNLSKNAATLNDVLGNIGRRLVR